MRVSEIMFWKHAYHHMNMQKSLIVGDPLRGQRMLRNTEQIILLRIKQKTQKLDSKLDKANSSAKNFNCIKNLPLR